MPVVTGYSLSEWLAFFRDHRINLMLKLTESVIKQIISAKIKILKLHLLSPMETM